MSTKFNWAGLGISLLTGALAAGGPALLANNSGVAGMGALLGALTGGLSFAQNPHAAPTTFDLASVGQQLANQEIASLVQHNQKTLGVLAPVAQQLVTNVVDSALTVPGTNVPQPAPATRSAVPYAPPAPKPVAPPVPAAPVPTPAQQRLQQVQAQQSALAAQQQALQEQIDAESQAALVDIAAPPTVGIPQL